MKWKDTSLDYTKNCVFIDEAGFNISMRNNWAKSASGTPAVVTIPNTRAQSHTIIGAIHSSSIIHVVLKKPSPKFETEAGNKKKRKANNGKKKVAAEINSEEPIVDIADITKPASKGTTTAHFVKFMNELLDVMDFDKNLKGSYIVMDNASIHKSQPMIRKIESKGYHVMFVSWFSA